MWSTVCDLVSLKSTDIAEHTKETANETFELVRENYNKVNKDYIIEQVQKACKYCANNPANGGTGICHCILGNPIIY